MVVEKVLVADGEDLGVEYADVEYSFKFFGQMFRVHPDAGELSYLDFVEAASKLDEENEAEGLPLVLGFLRQQIHPDDFDSFWTLAKKKKQRMDDLMKLSGKILESQSGFPTGQPSDSRAGRRATARKSKADSSKVATPRHRPAAAPKGQAALKLLKGRPDLQQVVVHALEAQSAG